MTKLHQVMGDLSRALNYQPRLNAHMAWRLHPEDFLEVIEEAKKHVMDLDQPWMPLGNFYLAGVRVFSDEDAPRLSEGKTSGT